MKGREGGSRASWQCLPSLGEGITQIWALGTWRALPEGGQERGKKQKGEVGSAFLSMTGRGWICT